MFKARLVLLPERSRRCREDKKNLTYHKERPMRIFFRIRGRRIYRTCRHVGWDEIIGTFSKITRTSISIRSSELVSVRGNVGHRLHLRVGDKSLTVTLGGSWAAPDQKLLLVLATFFDRRKIRPKPIRVSTHKVGS